MIEKDFNFNMVQNHISKILKKDIYINRNFSGCPHCNCQSFIKYGFFKGIQRYKCKCCKKTFSTVTNSIYSYSKKTLLCWLKFYEFTLEQQSLRYCSKKLNISLITAFNWRHKILRSLYHYESNKRLSNTVTIGKKFIKENFKGCRNITSSNRDFLWIFGAKDTSSSILIKQICRNMFDKIAFQKEFADKIDINAYVFTHGDRYISLFANLHNKKIKGSITFRTEAEYTSFFLLKVSSWLKKYNGVASKYLNNYLQLFKLFYTSNPLNSIILLYYSANYPL